MYMPTVVCGKCGKVAGHESAKAEGWLIAERVDRPGHMVIRCTEHITDHARRQAGLRQEYYHQQKAKRQGEG